MKTGQFKAVGFLAFILFDTLRSKTLLFLEKKEAKKLLLARFGVRCPKRPRPA